MMYLLKLLGTTVILSTPFFIIGPLVFARLLDLLSDDGAGGGIKGSAIRNPLPQP